jgi:hypothetical protein
VCIAGARFVQAEILEKYPQLDVQVYTIWFNVLATDHRGAWDNSLLTDQRVSHYWDEDLEIGRWYADNELYPIGSIAWDVYYLYGREAEWEEAPEPLLGWGFPVVGHRDELINQVMGLLE